MDGKLRAAGKVDGGAAISHPKWKRSGWQRITVSVITRDLTLRDGGSLGSLLMVRWLALLH